MEMSPIMIIAMFVIVAIVIAALFIMNVTSDARHRQEKFDQTPLIYHKRRGHPAIPKNIDQSYITAAKRLKCWNKKGDLRWSPIVRGVCPHGFLHTGVSATWPKRQCIGCAQKHY